VDSSSCARGRQTAAGAGAVSGGGSNVQYASVQGG
jgi:hypothetical protein